MSEILEIQLYLFGKHVELNLHGFLDNNGFCKKSCLCRFINNFPLIAFPLRVVTIGLNSGRTFFVLCKESYFTKGFSLTELAKTMPYLSPWKTSALLVDSTELDPLLL